MSPTEAFVLSRIDGTLTARDLATMTGMDSSTVEQTLERLADLGAVTWDGLVNRIRKGDEAREPKKPVEKASRGAQAPISERHDNPLPDPGEALALYDPAELDEDCDLPPDKRRRVLDKFYCLEDLTYYELLEVASDATKKQIKDSYYRLASEYHPDRYFRKNLGTFKQKMEAVFGRITLANDTLARKQSRQEYDDYLSMQQDTRRLERSLRREDQVSLGAVKVAGSGAAEERASRSNEAQPPGARYAWVPPRLEPGPDSANLANAQKRSNPPPSARSYTSREPSSRPVDPRKPTDPPISPRARGVPPSSPPSQKTSDPPSRAKPTANPMRISSSSTRQSVRIRRDAFAARMSGGRVSRIPPPPSSSQPPVRASLPPEQAGEALRRHVTERKEAVRRAQIKKYTDAAQEAMDRNDPAAAANAYQLALQLSPDDPALAQAHQDAQETATKMLAGGYLKQAQYEERAERWREAARSYCRAADGMSDDAEVQFKAAEMMLRSDLDLRRAAEYAKRALTIDSNNVRYRVVLGKIYLAAGLVLNARREFEQAAELAPKDATIARLLEGIRKSARS